MLKGSQYRCNCDEDSVFVFEIQGAEVFYLFNIINQLLTNILLTVLFFWIFNRH